MCHLHIFTLVCLSLVSHIHCFPNVYGKLRQEPYCSVVGEPLILTPLLKEGKIKEAQIAAKVPTELFQEINSYSAYFTVDEKYGSNLFFWFFPAIADYKNAPIVLWLQGGPGASSMIGLFTENGPFRINSKLQVELSEYSWSYNHSVIYIDSPVGTGYSFTNQNGYAQNQTIIGEHLHQALIQFFQLFPQLRSNHFYVSGESYGGKYVPVVSYAIHKHNMDAQQKINLQGLLIGNGISDPLHQFRYSEYLYQIGLIDLNEKEQFRSIEEKGIQLIKEEKWMEAYKLFDELIKVDTNPATLFQNISGFKTYYNYLESIGLEKKTEYMAKFLQMKEVRDAIHVGNTTFHVKTVIVKQNLHADITKSVAPVISQLLSEYRILIFNGQLDIIVPYPQTSNYLQNLNFSSADEYKNATRHKWYVDNELAGYVKQAGNLTEVLVRNAGHMVPQDQPKWANDLISKFVRNLPIW